MINRITENMKFSMVTNNMFSLQDRSAALMEQLSTQKTINRPSDDPAGTSNILNYRSAKASIAQYQKNITDANTWLSLTDTNISGIKDVIAQAISIATAESGGAAENTMDSSATVLSDLIAQAMSLLNAKSGDSYLFGGSRTDVAPFSATPATVSLGTPSEAATNAFDGTVTSGGTFTGTEDKMYAVKIINGGNPATLTPATYQISADGGKTWGEAQNLSAQVVKGSMANTTLVGGVSLPITAGTVWNAITGANVQNGTTVKISGTDHDGNVVGGLPADTFTITNTDTVQGLLTQIQTTFGGTVTASIDTAGKITVTDNETGDSQMAMALTITNPPGGALTFGTVATTTSIINLGDGVNMTVIDSGAQHLTANDLFTVSASFVPSYSSASAATANTFNGTVTSGGPYTGTENKTYALKIIDGGTALDLSDASYQVSDDGGKTWDATQTDLSTAINFGDGLGVTMTFTPAAGAHTLAANDLFTVNAYAPGYYQGNDDQQTMQIGKNNNFVYNITGSAAFTAVNGPVAAATIVSTSALTVEDTITLTRGGTAGSWTPTNNINYPDMVITSQNASTITIDADNDGTNDIQINLSGEWKKGNTASFTIIEGGTPPAPELSSVTVRGPGTVDLLKTLNTLKAALESHDATAVAAQIEDLQVAQIQVLTYQTQVGSKMNSLTVTGENHTAFNEQITTLSSKIEDVDLAKLITSYQMQQVAMQASYSMAAQIGKMTILDFLK